MNEIPLFSLTNEDPSLELHISEDVHPKSILCYCGSGARVIPLLSAQPHNMTLVDSSLSNLFLAELRISTIKNLNYEEFLFFWGYPPFNEERLGKKRERLFLSLSLTSNCKNYFMDLFCENDWEGLLYCGKWEKKFSLLSKLIKLTLGKSYDEIFKQTTLSDQLEYLENSFPQKKWNVVLKIWANSNEFNSLINKGNRLLIRGNEYLQEKSRIIPKSEQFFDKSHKFIKDKLKMGAENNLTSVKGIQAIFDRLLTMGLARENFFLQLIFHGKVIYPQGLPLEADGEIFRNVKRCLNNGVNIRFLHYQSFADLEKIKLKHDFISFNFNNDFIEESENLKFWSLLYKLSEKDGVLCLRSSFALNDPSVNFRLLNEVYELPIEREKTGLHHKLILKRI